MGSTLSTERIHNENGTGEIQNIEGNSNIIMNTVSNNIQTIQNENATVETQTIVQNNIIMNNTSTKEPELDDYNFPKPIDSFKGREGEIEQLEDYLFQKDKEIVVIWGLPGFGKSELIKQFAQKCKLNNKIKYICWMEASNKDTLEHSFKNLAEILNLPKVDGRALMQKVNSRYQDSGTLFLFDDVDSPRSLLDWETPRGCWTLVSSQCGAWGTKPRIELGPLELEAAVSVLQHEQNETVAADPDLYTLAKLLDNAPLALQLAAACIRQEKALFPTFNLLKYIKELKKSRENFVNEPLPEDTFLPYRHSIQAAMKLSIEKIRNLNKFQSNLALDILNILAYLDPNQILEELLLEFTFVQNKLNEAEDEDEERDPEKEVRRALYLLQIYSFIHLEDGYVRIHGLVQHSLFFYNKINANLEELYISCLNYVVNKKFNWHSETILRQADKNFEIFKKFYEENKSKIIENKSNLNYETLCILIMMNINNMGDAHTTMLLASKIKNDINSCDVNFENVIKDISSFSFLQILVMAEAKKCLTYTFEELGSQAKEVISEHQLHFSAMYSQQLNTINLLLRYEEDINKIIIAGLPITHVAVCVLNIDNLKNFLLEHNNIDVNVRDEEGNTCIYHASWHYFSIIIDYNRNFMENVFVTKIRTLVAHGAFVDNVTNDGRSLLHVALAHIKNTMHLKIVEFIMDELQLDVNTQDTYGMTALHVILGRRILLEIDDELTGTLVDILMKRGASIHVYDNGGYSPLKQIKGCELHFLLPILESYNVAGNFHILHYAVSILNLDILNIILDYNNTDVNARDEYGCTCIFKAFSNFFAMQLDTGGKICHVLRALVNRGASVYNVTNTGCSLLHTAVLHIKFAKDLMVVEFIVDELQVDVNTRSTQGNTALHLILNRRHLQEIDEEFTGKLVDILMKRSANIHIKDNYGYRPLDFAVSILNLDILNVILQYNNTDVNARYDNRCTCICQAFGSFFEVQLVTGDKICHVLRALVDRGASVYNVTNDGCSLLHIAVLNIKTAKNLKVVEFIVDELQVDVNTRNTNGRTALHFILKRRKMHKIDDEFTGKLVDILVRRGANILIKDNGGYSPLYDAVRILNLDILNVILQYSDVNARDDNGCTCICQAFGSFFEVQLDTEDKICHVLRALMDHGASVYNVTNDGSSLLHIAVLHIKTAKDVKVVEFIVDELQVDVNTQNTYGKTALHLNSRETHGIDDELTGKLVDILMKRGASIHIKDNDGYSPLDYAACILNLEILNIILEYNNTDLNARDDNGWTSICNVFYSFTGMQLDTGDKICHVLRALVDRGASVYNVTNDGCSLLHIAVLNIKTAKNLKVVEFIVDELQVDVNTRNTNGRTALHFILKRRKMHKIDDEFTGKLVDILVRRGANILIKDNGGYSPLYDAVRILNLDILNVILQYSDVNARDDNGCTCICQAFGSFFEVQLDTEDKICHVLRALMDHGASVYNVTNDGSSLLHIAVLHIKTAKDVKVVEFIVDELQVDVNTQNTYGKTALHLNSRETHGIDDELTGKLVDILMKRGASIHIKDNDGYSPLDYAACILNLEILNIILEYNNTDLNARDDNGWTSICNVFYSFTGMQLDTGDKICHVLRALVDRGASVYNVTNDGCSLLHIAVLNIKTAKNLKVVEFIVDELQVDVNTRNTNGRTALHFILKRRKMHKIDDEFTGKLVDILVRRGANILIKDNGGYSPLYDAVRILNLDILNVILQYSDVNARDDNGCTCICQAFGSFFEVQLDTEDKICHVLRALMDHGASVYNVTNDGSSLLHIAVLHIKTAKDVKVVEFIVDELQVDVNTQNTYGKTALHLNSRETHGIDDELTGKLVDILMKRGASIHIKDNDGYSPLDYAACILNLEILNIILEYNNTDLNARDDNGWTSICNVFYSFTGMQLDTGDKICHVLRALVDRGASVYNVTNDGCSLLHIAVLNIKTAKNLKVVEFIVDELQVDVNTRNTNGRTALHFILKRRKMHKIDDEFTGKLVDILVRRGANILIKDNGGYSPLYDAVRILNLDILNVILQYSDVNARDDNGCTCICQAFGSFFEVQLDTEDKICHVLRALMDHGASVYNVTNDGSSLLHIAVLHIKTAKDVKVVEFIVDELQVDVNTQNTYGKTALHLNSRETHGIDDELTGKLVDILMKRGASIHIKDNDGYSPLDYAACILNLEILNIILEYNNTDLNARDDNGWTSICNVFYSFTGMQLDTGDKICHVLRALVDRGASVYNVTNDGCSLLHIAVLNIKTAKNLKVVEFIVDELQVDVNTRNTNGRTALHFILKRRKMHKIDDEFTGKLVDILVRRGANILIKDNGGYSPLYDAVRILNLDILNVILQYSDVNARDDNGCTCICQAFGSFFEVQLDTEDKICHVLRALMDHGASVYNVTNDGSSLLHIAVLHIKTAKDVKVVEFIVDELQVDVNTQNTYGKTALHLNSRETHGIDDELTGKLVDILMKRGASIHIKDNDGYSPLDYAACILNLEILNIILEYNNTDLNARDDNGWTSICNVFYSFTGMQLDTGDKICHVLRALVDRGASVYNVTNDGCSLLHIAVLNIKTAKNLKVVEFIVDELQVDVNTRNTNGRTALHFILKRRKMHKIDDEFTGKLVDILVRRGANILIKDNGGYSPLYDAVRILNLDILNVILQYSDVNARDDNGCTCICQAFGSFFEVQLDTEDKICHVLRALMDHGASVYNVTNDGSSLLHIAVLHIKTAKDVKVVEFIVDELQVDVNTQNTYGKTALHLNSRETHGIDDELTGKLVDILMKRGASIHIKDNDGYSPLDYAACILNLEILNIILEYNNTDLNARDDNGWTSICNVFYSFTGMQLDTGDKICHVLRALVDRGASVYNVTNDGCSLLHIAVLNIKTAKNLKVVEFIVDELQVDVNTRNTNGRTALHFILKRRKMHKIDDEFTGKLVDILVRRGANILIKDNGGYSPLYDAVRILNLDILNVILQYSDVNARDDNGCTCICQAFGSFFEVQLDTEDKICHVLRALMDHGASVYNVTNDGSSLLHIAVLHIKTAKDVKVVEFIVDELQVDVNTQNTYGKTALHLNSRETHGIDDELTGKLVDILMKRGASIHIKDNDGYSPLDYAACILNLEILNIILEYNNTDLNARDDNGWTSICNVFYSFTGMQLDTGDKICHVLRALVDRGASVYNVTNYGWSLLHIAVQNIKTAKDLKVVEFIVDELQVDVDTRDIKGMTALHFILVRRLLQEIDVEFTSKLVDILLKLGANIHIKESNGISPLDAIKKFELHFLLPILESNNGEGSFNVLHYAVTIFNLDILNVILEYNNTDVNVRADDGLTCICEALCGFFEVQSVQLDTRDKICDALRCLVDRGASVYNVTSGGLSLLHAAVVLIKTAKDLKVVEFIVDELQVDVNTRDINGRTALHFILNRRHLQEIDDEFTGKLVDILMKRGANFHIKDNDGYSPPDSGVEYVPISNYL